MPDDITVRQWFERYGDWFAFSQLIALMVGSVIGFRQRSRGLAILFTHISASVVAIICFMAGIGQGYGTILVSISAGVIGGGLGWVLFGLLITLSDRLDKRREEIADKVINKVPIIGGDK